MPLNPQCKNCSHTIIRKTFKFCPHCGQKTNISRINFGTVVDEFMAAFHFESNKLLITICLMISSPGKSLIEYLNGVRHKFQSPVSFLFLSLLFYGVFVHLVAEPQGWYIGILLTFSQYKIILLMIGFSLFGWLISGHPKYNFFEIFVIFAYTYGTSIFLNPLWLLAQAPFIKEIKALPHTLQYLASDLPSTFILMYILYDFFRVAGIPLYRFLATAVLGYLYYFYFIELMG